MLRRQVIKNWLLCIQLYSSYEEETDRKDDKGYQIYNIYDRYYILISGTNLGYRTLFRRSDNIGNDILVELANDISNNRHHEIFQELIDDGIFNNYFVSASPGKHSIETDGLAENAIKLKTDTYAYDDIEYIKKQLPKCFSMQSLLPMVRVYKKNDFSVSVKSFIDYIIQNIDHKQYYSKKEFYEAAKEFIDIISPISTEETIIDDLSILIGPQYLVPELDDDDGISDAELDEIFREKYDKHLLRPRLTGPGGHDVQRNSKAAQGYTQRRCEGEAAAACSACAVHSAGRKQSF